MIVNNEKKASDSADGKKELGSAKSQGSSCRKRVICKVMHFIAIRQSRQQ